jgi:ABC-type polar amino acid transport system ATPase subunit
VAQGARVLLLDEPTSALDESLRGDVAALLQKLARGEIASSTAGVPLTLVVVTHDESFARGIATVTWRMEHGKIKS